tara:strand:+ start:1584 stop:1820 length:237 start_codon:yes stop_codon:yes gene_type:complete
MPGRISSRAITVWPEAPETEAEEMSRIRLLTIKVFIVRMEASEFYQRPLIAKEMIDSQGEKISFWNIRGGFLEQIDSL